VSDTDVYISASMFTMSSLPLF